MDTPKDPIAAINVCDLPDHCALRLVVRQVNKFFYVSAGIYEQTRSGKWFWDADLSFRLHHTKDDLDTAIEQLKEYDTVY